MEFCVTIADAEFVAIYDAKVTNPGAPETGPSYASGGEPAEAMEFEVTVITLYKDLGGGKRGPDLEIPAWLREEIEDAMQNSDDVYEAVCEASQERDYDN